MTRQVVQPPKITAAQVAKLKRLYKAECRPWAPPKIRVLKVVGVTKHSLFLDGYVGGRKQLGIRWLTGLLNGDPLRRNVQVTRVQAMQFIVPFFERNLKYCRASLKTAVRNMQHARAMLLREKKKGACSP